MLIAALRHFELFWFIQHLVTDNGSHQTNDEFQKFLKENDIFYHDYHCSWASCDQWVSGTLPGIIQGKIRRKYAGKDFAKNIGQVSVDTNEPHQQL